MLPLLVQELAEAVQGLVDGTTHQVLTAGTALPLLLPERLPLLASMADSWTAYATLAAEDSAPSASPDTGKQLLRQQMVLRGNLLMQCAFLPFLPTLPYLWLVLVLPLFSLQ